MGFDKEFTWISFEKAFDNDSILALETRCMFLPWIRILRFSVILVEDETRRRYGSSSQYLDAIDNVRSWRSKRKNYDKQLVVMFKTVTLSNNSMILTSFAVSDLNSPSSSLLSTYLKVWYHTTTLYLNTIFLEIQQNFFFSKCYKMVNCN